MSGRRTSTSGRQPPRRSRSKVKRAKRTPQLTRSDQSRPRGLAPLCRHLVSVVANGVCSSWRARANPLSTIAAVGLRATSVNALRVSLYFRNTLRMARTRRRASGVRRTLNRNVTVPVSLSSRMSRCDSTRCIGAVASACTAKPSASRTSRHSDGVSGGKVTVNFAHIGKLPIEAKDRPHNLRSSARLRATTR